MAERVFNYQNIGTAYQNMNSKFGEISTLLSAIDTEYKARVNVEDEALFGDLGSQLLLDWENTSSNFPNFMTNFENWSAVVSLAAGNYSQFETDLAGFKAVTTGNYLGATAQAAGITTNFVDSSSYNNAYSSEEIAGFKDLAQYYALTGATYVDTGMVEFGKRNNVFNIVTDSLSVVGILASGAYVFKTVSTLFGGAVQTAAATAGAAGDAAALRMASNTVTGGFSFSNLGARVSGTLTPLTQAYQNAAITTKFWTTAAGSFLTNPGLRAASTVAGIQNAGLGATGIISSIAGNVTSAIGSRYDINKYGSGLDNANPWGNNVVYNNDMYFSLGTTPAGNHVYANADGKIFYKNGNNEMEEATAVDKDGKKIPATLNDLNGDFVMNINGENVDQNVSLTPDRFDYYAYTDSVTGIENRSSSGNASGN